MSSTAKRTADEIIGTIRAEVGDDIAKLAQRLEGALRHQVALVAEDKVRLDHLIEGEGAMCVCDWDEPGWLPVLKIKQGMNARQQIDEDMAYVEARNFLGSDE